MYKILLRVIYILINLTIIIHISTAYWWHLGTYSIQNNGLIDTTKSTQSFKDICQNSTNLSYEQIEICLRSQRILSALSQAAKIGKEECQIQFRNNRWNCSTFYNTSSIYGNVINIKSRETAYVYAINAAALAWSITRACSKGELTECSCDNNIRRKQRKWQWGGCSEDINYGVIFSKKFTDSQESHNSSEGLMNLHNNEAGRRALKVKMQRICKCHGMSGSCSLRVCWRRLSSMRAVGEALGNLYDGASLVKVVERDGKPSKLRRRDPLMKKLVKSDLVFLEESPDYCEPNPKLNILGTKGRFCNRTSPGIDGCRLLCCGRGYQTRLRQVQEKCKCKFVWCCSVKCAMCNYKREEHICN
ncbi:protein Wnt-1-like [Condylostylus longicornis]|uniref:protein Wnt-1-like n=1 Tax=Condylostylus longicornis TaxID=2530218 RepID=UPI00244DD42B|nr:protein Wnt-1-like [Condylostylus longicornis]